MKMPIVFLVALTLFGCASTGVVPVGEDTYMIAKKDGTPGLGVSYSNKAEVYREANEFCRMKGLVVKTVQETVTPAAPARLGSTELKFRCVAPSKDSGTGAQP